MGVARFRNLSVAGAVCGPVYVRNILFRAGP